MQTRLKTAIVWLAATLSPWAFAAPGEYWELTMKVEMAGMPFAMPTTTIKVCMPKGSERDPKYSTDKDCVVTDVKNTGNKTSWKMQCNRKGEILNGSGEMTGTLDNAEGVMRLNGMSDGHKIDMTQTYKNKRLGGACDTEEMANKIKGQIGDMCETTAREFAQDTSTLMSHAKTLLNEKICPGRKPAFCDAVRKDVVRNAATYDALVNGDKIADLQVASSCGINMEASTQAICKTLKGDNIRILGRYCPVEAKAYREDQRRRACEGRTYTAKEDLGKCLRGEKTSDEADDQESNDSNPQAQGPVPSGAGSKAGRTVKKPSENSGNNSNQAAPEQPSAPNPAGALIDGAKKLKGLFGF